MDLSVSKIKTRDEIRGLLEDFRRKKLRVGFTSGVFDILHRGHVEYLGSAKKHCDVLVVGLNSDSSVKKIKGEARPVNNEMDRAAVVSEIQMVDLVFLFEEENNNKNVEILKPDVYVKAGEYDRKRLTSASIVESYGGKVVLVPYSKGYSSTNVIEKISALAATSSIDLPLHEKRPAIFVDRDGTLIEHVEHLHEAKKLVVISGTLEGLKRLRDSGYRIVIITNQPGIGLGYFTKEDFFTVTKELLRAATKIGLAFDKIYFCPHSAAENCDCRKPKTALIKRAVSELNIDLSRSFVVGDTSLDIMLGQAVGCKTVLVKTGLRGEDGAYNVSADKTAKDFSVAVDWILKSREGE